MKRTIHQYGQLSLATITVVLVTSFSFNSLAAGNSTTADLNNEPT